MSQVWELDLPRDEKIVLLAFADFADDDGYCYPSLDRIAWKCGYSRSSVKRKVAQLASRHLLGVVEEGVGRGNTSRYLIRPEKGSKLTRPGPEKGSSETGKGSTAVNEKGVTAMTPESSLTVREPSVGTKRRKRCSLPDSWRPHGDHRAFALAEHLDIEDEFERFRDHHLAKGTLSADWSASLRTWLRNAVKFRDRDADTHDPSTSNPAWR